MYMGTVAVKPPTPSPGKSVSTLEVVSYKRGQHTSNDPSGNQLAQLVCAGLDYDTHERDTSSQEDRLTSPENIAYYAAGERTYSTTDFVDGDGRSLNDRHFSTHFAGNNNAIKLRRPRQGKPLHSPV